MRAVIYQRVSTEEQVQGYSLDAQERAGRLYAAAHGWEVTHVYADEGRSARYDDLSKRPAFRQMLEDADASRFDVLIVHKLDRFARNILVTLETLRRLEAHGIGFSSISEQMDFTTPIGKVILATLAAFAQYYSDNLSHEVKKGKAERKAQGLYNGLLPFGVTTDAHGVPIPDEVPWACNVVTREELVPARGLRTAFELAASGKSDREVAIALNALGYRTSGNRGQNPFTKDTVRPLLQNRFYVGELPDGDGWLPGKHAPIVDPLLFQRAQAHRTPTAQRTRSVPAGRRTYALSGLLRCGACGAPLRVQSSDYYRCANAGQNRTCRERGVPIRAIDAQVGDLVRIFAFPEERLDLFVAAVRRQASVDHGAAAQRVRLERQLARLKELYLEGDVSRAEYTQRKGAIGRELDALPVSPYSTTGETRLRGVVRYLSHLGTAWDVADDGERHAIVERLFAAIYVANRTAVAVVPRPELRGLLVPVLETGTAQGRKRRGSDAHLRGLPDTAVAVIIDEDGPRRYSVPRKRKLTPNEIACIRLEQNRTLRELADAYGVSHETIRTVRNGGYR